MLPENTSSPTTSNWFKFLGGVLGWFVVNTFIYVTLNRLTDYITAMVLWLGVLLLNVVVMIVLLVIKKTRMIVYGMVAAMALNFAIAISLLMTNQAMCFIPVTYSLFEPTARPTRMIPFTTAKPANKLPIGFHDGNSGDVSSSQCVAFGWTTDPDDRTIDLDIRVLADGEEVAKGIANLVRPDLNRPEGCPVGSCGYSINLWGLVTANESHTILVQARDAQTGNWATLSNSLKKLECHR